MATMEFKSTYRTLFIATIATFMVTKVVAVGYEQPYYSHSNTGDYYGNTEEAAGYPMEWPAGGGLQQNKKCIDIPHNMSLCKGIGYTRMRIPNLLDHDTIREVTQQASSWVPLLGIRCHPDTKLFLCSLFSPVCLDRPIWPCRTLCEAVKNGCEALMLKYGFPWPEMLRCDKFPLDNDLCISLQTPTNKEVLQPRIVGDNTCQACNHPATFEAIADSYCSADIVVRVSIDEHVLSGSDLKIITSRKKKKIKEGDLTKREVRNLLLYITQGASCECPHLTQQQQDKAEHKKNTHYLAMTTRAGDQLVLEYLAPLDLSNKDMKRAWKAMRNGSIMCKNGLPVLEVNTGDKKGKRGKKHKKGRGKDKKAETEDGGMKRRKNCKNPKKCVSTSDTKSENGKKRRKDKNDRRKSRRRESRAVNPFYI